jgi:hypothetical protein
MQQISSPDMSRVLSSYFPQGSTMVLSDPVAVYNAANNVDVHLICALLEENGIEAHATLDESLAGYWMFGTLPEIHNPQVWVDRSNMEAAMPLLEKFELDRKQRRLKEFRPDGTRRSDHGGLRRLRQVDRVPLCEACHGPGLRVLRRLRRCGS